VRVKRNLLDLLKISTQMHHIAVTIYSKSEISAPSQPGANLGPFLMGSDQ